MMNLRRKTFACCIGAAVVSIASPALLAATPTTWTTTIDSTTSSGTYGSITFNDWGYTGPTGVGAGDFQVGTGFDASRIGQIQHVVTKNPDGLTRDAPYDAYRELTDSTTDLPAYPRANMDGAVNFYQWAYTTPVNSTFSNMQIDKAGNYHIGKTDMSFGFYDVFKYTDTAGIKASTTKDTFFNFQPYATSDARGWCGSVLNQDPNGVGVMAGQVTFDFAMDVYYDYGTNPGTFSSTQLIPGFVMRSYGSYTVNTTTVEGVPMNFSGSAVMNNNNPTINPLNASGEVTGAALDPNYQNQVSFLGAGVVPAGVWVSADSFNPDGSRKMRTDYNATTGASGLRWDVTMVPEGTPGAVWHSNAFGGYAFMLRADGSRTLDFISPTGHSDYVSTAVATVPVPAAAWLFGSGLLGLSGIARRKRRA